MKNKWWIYIGIILLAFGILLKKMTDLSIIPILLILLGAIFKINYLVLKLRSGEYKPGYELLLLLIGLLLFLSGMYLKSHESSVNPAFFIIPGIIMKIGFVIMFIIKTQKKHSE
ncbi:hypothetical protein ACFLTE_01015 [Bacteroidota bacterium]